jgi:hypothetical protein
LDTSERQRFSDVVGVCSPGVSSLHSGHATIEGTLILILPVFSSSTVFDHC